MTSNLYSESDINEKSELKLDLSETGKINQINVESLKGGYYRLFAKINGQIYWENIFIQKIDNEFQLEWWE